jgi:nucleotide-binding universal stress UspA family protein
VKKIVVGVDGSESARRALEWAVAEAKMREAEVVAIYSWSLPAAVGALDAIIVPADVDLQKEAEMILAGEIEAVAGNADVPIRGETVRASAASALLDASKDADLLVVGSRGLGGFRGLLLGSVGHKCAHHSHCPVVIVPHEGRGPS